jgi:L-2-hydroxyglutarate oxidase LhgO
LNVPTYDTVIVGGGIMGLSLARELKRRDAGQRIAVLEKETSLGRHASGRNSGVLHSGIYYPSGSLKATLCADGARRMAAYCRERNLPLAAMGKVILPTRAADDPQIDLLVERARANGARAELIDELTLRELEPEARSATGRALFSPDTAVVDSKKVLAALSDELTQAGVDIQLGQRLESAKNGALTVNGTTLSYGLLINAAGLHADVIARSSGVGERYVILPFKGIYYRLLPSAPFEIRRLIYPVPDLRVPFLGVHFTRSVTGEVHLGPTAVPAFGRENYRGWAGVEAADAGRIVTTLARQYVSNKQGFRTFVHEEAGRFLKPLFVNAARALVPRLRSRDLATSEKVGIRAQLFDKERQELVMDFVLERGERSLHVLNAVSPGFTSAFSFASYALDQL